MEVKDLSGQKFGRLTVIEKTESDKHGHAMWRCVCDCGNESIINSSSLIRNLSKSCGCLRKEIIANRSITHKHSTHPLYYVWEGIKHRCYRLNYPAYPLYGGRGIDMDEEWRKDPMLFIKWALNNNWQKGLDTHRIDNDKGYYPNNLTFMNRSDHIKLHRQLEKE